MPISYILLTGFYCFLIFENSAVSDPIPVDITFPFADKLAHAVLYGGLCAIVSVGMSRPPRTVSWRVLALVPILFATAYGITDEIHQRYVPHRTFDYADMVADFFGAAAAQSILLLHWSRIRHRDNAHSRSRADAGATSRPL